MIEALDTEHFISNVLSEILFNEPINTTSVQHGIIFKAYMNHSIEIDILHILWLVSTDFAIKIAIIKQMLEKKRILHTFEWIPAKQQLADCLNKQGASSLNLGRAIQNGHTSYWYFYWHFVKKICFVKGINNPENKGGMLILTFNFSYYNHIAVIQWWDLLRVNSL